MKFVRFQEYNDHEGETWNSWLQLDGNELDIEALAERLRLTQEDSDFDLDYTLHLTQVEPESVVDKLCLYAECGYGYSHSKVTGKFTCPEDLGPDAEKLYKGRIRDFFKKDEA